VSRLHSELLNLAAILAPVRSDVELSTETVNGFQDPRLNGGKGSAEDLRGQAVCGLAVVRNQELDERKAQSRGWTQADQLR
jgi:hypothetical protein